jgi:hypothetical protein
LVGRPDDSAAAKLVHRMRKLVREDRGHFPAIDTATYASIAALIKVREGLSPTALPPQASLMSTLPHTTHDKQHNGLAAEALAVANETRPDVPEALVRVWRSGAKMRQWFQYGDVQAARLRDGEAPR